ncbi:hypothetical protein ANN_16586 [Periplaneta americana]|uniref:Uncharacterized protein n=1 Tax=Periplaneta americana TaxID=6978 RepID=A0ABQ8SQT2_PERAM|nr:hypothetical protein ANN_16586 [Periplaneta americana]
MATPFKRFGEADISEIEYFVMEAVVSAITIFAAHLWHFMQDQIILYLITVICISLQVNYSFQLQVKKPILISKICILNSKCVPGSVGNKVRDKLEQVLQRNVGLKDLRTASDILAGKNTDLQCDIPVQLVSKLKYAPVTSVDVELSFSAYKFVLSDRRHYFLVENLGKVLVIYCDANYQH